MASCFSLYGGKFALLQVANGEAKKLAIFSLGRKTGHQSLGAYPGLESIAEVVPKLLYINLLQTILCSRCSGKVFRLTAQVVMEQRAYARPRWFSVQ